MTEVKHTNLRTGYIGREVLDNLGNIYAKTYSPDKANHIVKCVNMHDELVEALESDAARFKAIISKLDQWNYMTGTQRADYLNAIWHYECECRATLKKTGAL